MLAERTALLKQLEEKNNKINDVINHMASIVGGEQHDMVEAIGDNLQNVRANVSQANEELDEATTYQKKSKKKLVCLVVTIVIIVLAAGGMIYMLVA
jgi:t-SNARE complex subunit (syntaxin)